MRSFHTYVSLSFFFLWIQTYKHTHAEIDLITNLSLMGLSSFSRSFTNGTEESIQMRTQGKMRMHVYSFEFFFSGEPAFVRRLCQ